MKKRTLLIYAPNIGGHRHIYIKKCISAVDDNFQKIIISYRGILNKENRFEKAPSHYFDTLDRDNIELVYLEEEHDQKRILDEVRGLQETYGVDVTLFVDGDSLRTILPKQILPWRKCLRGKNYAILILSEFLYLGMINRKMSLERAALYFANPFKFNKDGLKIVLFYLMVKHFSILEKILCVDENLVRVSKSEKIISMPEIYDGTVEKRARDDFSVRVEKQLRSFLDNHHGKTPILLFGDLEERKGIDYYYQLVAENTDLLLLRIGRTKPGCKVNWQRVLWKEKIIIEDRLFEVDSYLPGDKVLIDLIFNSIKFMILPYINYFRTSGVMIQALSYGKPVLVPDRGLMRDRVVKNRIGRVFEHGNYDSFIQEFEYIRKHYNEYAEHIKKFNVKHSSKHLREVLLSL